MRKLRFTPVIQVKNSQQAELIQNIKFFLVHLLFTDTCSAYFCCYSLFRKNALRKKLMAMQKKKRKRIQPAFHIFCLVSPYRGEIFIDINTRVPVVLYWTKNIKNL